MNKPKQHERTMDTYLKKWLGGVILFLTITALGGVAMFIEMRVAVAENTKDITEVKEVTDDVTELRIRQEHLINDVKTLQAVVEGNRSILLDIAREVKK